MFHVSLLASRINRLEIVETRSFLSSRDEIFNGSYVNSMLHHIKLHFVPGKKEKQNELFMLGAVLMPYDNFSESADNSRYVSSCCEWLIQLQVEAKDQLNEGGCNLGC
jgi:hypothetical protein